MRAAAAILPKTGAFRAVLQRPAPHFSQLAASAAEWHCFHVVSLRPKHSSSTKGRLSGSKQCLSSRLTAWVSLIAKLTRKCEESASRLTATVMHPFSWMHHRRGQSTGALLAFSFAKHPPGGGSAAEWRCRQRLTVAPDETVILLHPPLHVVGVSIAMERYRQQNDSLVNG